jgi:hypothetical protein
VKKNSSFQIISVGLGSTSGDESTEGKKKLFPNELIELKKYPGVMNHCRLK